MCYVGRDMQELIIKNEGRDEIDMMEVNAE